MKIAIYTIAKNEAHNVHAFINSCKDADQIVILDTGSTDNTVDLIKQYPNVSLFEDIIIPWRFDTARNISLSHVRSDIDVCISIDMDERIEKSWRQKLESEWKGNFGNYQYIAEWQNKEKTIPLIVGPRTKIHARHDFYWTKPVHEQLTLLPDKIISVCNTSILVEHYSDGKQRNYIPLLNKILKKNPKDDVALMQKASEQIQLKQYKEAIKTNNKYLKLTENNDDPITKYRRCVTRISIAECYYFLNDFTNCVKSYIFAIGEDPTCREGWVNLAHIMNQINNIPLAYGTVMTALAIKEAPQYATKDMMCWGDIPQKIANETFAKIMRGMK